MTLKPNNNQKDASPGRHTKYENMMSDFVEKHVPFHKSRRTKFDLECLVFSEKSRYI